MWRQGGDGKLRLDQRRRGCLVHLWCLDWCEHEDGDGDGNNDSARVHACVCVHTRRGGEDEGEDACVRDGTTEGARKGRGTRQTGSPPQSIADVR